MVAVHDKISSEYRLKSTPVLMQELNLSRRACWLRIQNARRQKRVVCNPWNWLTSMPLDSNGAKLLFTCQETAGNNILANTTKQVTTENKETRNKKSNCDLSKFVYRSQLLQTLYLCLRSFTETIHNDYRIRKQDKRGRCQRALIDFNAVKLITFLFGCLLLSTNFVTARPNQSAFVQVKYEVESSENTQYILPTDLLETYPDLEYTGSHNKRAAELIQTSTSKITHEAIEAEHQVQRYPVAQVEFQRVKTPFIIGLWILSASVAKIGFHMTPKLHRIFPESCLLIVVGGIIGVVLFLATEVQVSPLTPNTFFFYMLPPIILDAGYFMPNRLFFDNLGTILLMAVVGTIFNIATIGASLWACGLTGLFTVEIPLLDSFLFSSLISAVDPVAVLAVFEEIHVDEVLYIVVFGESLLNDAVTVVLYHMMESYNGIGIQNINVTDLASGVASFFVVAIGGTIIGVIWGFLTGIVTRFTDHVRVIEPIFIFVMAYLAYLSAEIFHMSGILAITFCGITMKNYVESNISQKSHTTVKYALKMLSSSSETIIFMFLGVATINNRHVWNTWFVLLTIFFCSIFRVIGVIILGALANHFRIHKLTKVDQFVMSYGGLRGAVAFALALLVDETHVPLQPMFVTTTIAVIYFTVFVQGITIKPLVRLLNVKRASKRKPTMNERIHERFMDHLMAGIEDIIGKTGNHTMRDKFKRFDNRFIRPLLLRDAKGAEPKIIETYSKLTMKDAMEVLRRNPSTIGQMSGTESMSALFRNYTTGYLGGSPSFSNLETCSRNLDMHELDYNPSKKDLTDAKIHHLLAEELKPYRRHRRLSYSRHAVDDRDLSTQVNYKMHMNIRRMVNDRKHHKRSKRSFNKDGLKQNHVSFNDFQENRESPKHLMNVYVNDVVKDALEDNKTSSASGMDDTDWDEDALTFTAKSTLGDTSMIAEEDRTPQKLADFDQQRVATPTAIESQLPWKRNEDDAEDGEALKQNEFPAWVSNKEYLAYNSPSATFLGMFRRESSGSGYGSVTGAGSVNSDIHAPETSSPALTNPPLTLTRQQTMDLSVKRGTKKGSSLEISGTVIPEESNQMKSPNEADEWITRTIDNKGDDSDTENEKDLTNEKVERLGREPLLPKPIATSSRIQSRQINQNPLTTALLSASNILLNSDQDDDDEEEEDIDVYDDDHIVNSSIVNRKQNSTGNSCT